MYRKLYLSNEVKNWNGALKICTYDQTELFVLLLKEETKYLAKAYDYVNHSEKIWLFWNETDPDRHNENIGQESCPLLKMNNHRIEFDFEPCSNTYKFICSDIKYGPIPKTNFFTRFWNSFTIFGY